MKYKQFYANESEPVSFACVISDELIPATLPEGYVSISAKEYRRLKWLQRKFRILARRDRISERASKVRRALVD